MYLTGPYRTNPAQAFGDQHVARGLEPRVRGLPVCSLLCGGTPFGSRQES